MKGIARVKAVRLKGIMFECTYFILWQYEHSSFRWSSITTSDHEYELEAVLHFDECELTFCDAKGQSTYSMINLLENKEIELSFIVKCRNEITEGQLLRNSGRS